MRPPRSGAGAAGPLQVLRSRSGLRRRVGTPASSRQAGQDAVQALPDVVRRTASWRRWSGRPCLGLHDNGFPVAGIAGQDARRAIDTLSKRDGFCQTKVRPVPVHACFPGNGRYCDPRAEDAGAPVQGPVHPRLSVPGIEDPATTGAANAGREASAVRLPAVRRPALSDRDVSVRSCREPAPPGDPPAVASPVRAARNTSQPAKAEPGTDRPEAGQVLSASCFVAADCPMSNGAPAPDATVFRPAHPPPAPHGQDILLPSGRQNGALPDQAHACPASPHPDPTAVFPPACSPGTGRKGYPHTPALRPEQPRKEPSAGQRRQDRGQMSICPGPSSPDARDRPGLPPCRPHAAMPSPRGALHRGRRRQRPKTLPLRNTQP